MSSLLVHIEKYWVHYFMLGTISFISLSVFIYEFYLENTVFDFVALHNDDSEESPELKLEFVLTSIFFSTMGLLVAGIVLLKLDTQRRLAISKANKLSASRILQIKEQYEHLIQQIPIGVYLFVSSPCGDMRFDFVSPKFCEIYGIERDDFLSDPLLAFSSTHPEDYESLVAANKYATESGEFFLWEGRFVIDGQCKWVEISSEPNKLPNGDIMWSGIIKDVTKQKQMEVDMKLSHFVMEHAPINITFLDSEARIQYVNKAACETLGYTRDELLKMGIPDIDPQFPMEVWGEHWKNLKEMKSIPVETEHQRKNGERFPVEVIANYIEFDDKAYNIAFDIDISVRKLTEEKIKKMAYHDYLTGLPNRALFFDRLEQDVAHSHRSQKPLAVLVLDLDHFKEVNDKLGHAHGDEALIEVSRRLKKCIRETDTASRLGGDEFSLILTDLSSKNAACKIAEKIIAAIDKPLLLNESQHSIGVSIGIYMVSMVDKNMELIVNKADMAMYQAKEVSESCYRIY